MDQPAKGAAALERALALAPQDPEVMISLAQALAAAADGQLQGRPTDLIAAALAAEPDHATGLWLHGLAAYQAKDFAQAVERWERLAQGLDPNGEDAAQLRQFIADAREEGGLPAAAPDASPPGLRQTSGTSSVSTTRPDAPSRTTASGTSPAESSLDASSTAAAGLSLQVEVSLAQPLWREANVNHSLFIYAKAASGPPMPLAVKRLKVADLPLTVTLDDSLAMTPEMTLSKFSPVIVGARISASGQASPQSGDLEGETGPIAPADHPSVKVLIDRIRP
jgi:cytochrome c-type biogenesis protein CcmH